MSIPKHQYIYRIQPNRPELLTDGPTKSEAKILRDHVAYIEGLVDSANILLAGRTQTADPNGFGIVIVSASSEEEGRAIMDEDPVVKTNLMKAEFFTYKIAFLSDSILQVTKNDA
jgi:uncharacterized protein YciI